VADRCDGTQFLLHCRILLIYGYCVRIVQLKSSTLVTSFLGTMDPEDPSIPRPDVGHDVDAASRPHVRQQTHTAGEFMQSLKG
jgi:hypothetical protein